MDPAVAAGIRHTASGEEYMDMSKIAQDLASTMKNLFWSSLKQTNLVCVMCANK